MLQPNKKVKVLTAYCIRFLYPCQPKERMIQKQDTHVSRIWHSLDRKGSDNVCFVDFAAKSGKPLSIMLGNTILLLMYIGIL
jgi:hypothetical protein